MAVLLKFFIRQVATLNMMPHVLDDGVKTRPNPSQEGINSKREISFHSNPQTTGLSGVNVCRPRQSSLVTGRGAPSSVASAADVNAIFDAVIFKRGKARGYFAVPKYFATACIGASHAIAFVKYLHAIFLAFHSQRRQNRYLRSNDAFVSYDASVRLDCYEMSRGR
jgi:hypothetical protein